MGATALIVAILPVVGAVGAIVGLVALGIGIAGAVKNRQRQRAIIGAALGAVAVPVGVAMTMATAHLLGDFFAADPAWVRSDVATMEELLGRGEYDQDDCISIKTLEPSGDSVDYVASNTCDTATPAALFILDALDSQGTVIASGRGDVASLDPTGPASTYSSYTVFDADVTDAASFVVRDLDARNALSDEWWNESEDPWGDAEDSSA